MIRVLNFFCVALMGLSILGLYHVSEKTRVASVELGAVTHQIEGENARISVLETEWEHTASPLSVESVAAIRTENKDRTKAWTAEELAPIKGGKASKR